MQSRKEDIQTAAARLIRKKGYKATTMRGIAQAVGVKAASIYNHFASKQEILSDLLMDMAHRFSDGMRDISHQDLTVEGKLKKLIALHIQLTVDHTDASAMIANEWRHLEEPARSEYIKLRDEYEEDFTRIIEQGKREGVVQEMDTKVILFSVLSTLRWLYSWYSRHRDYDIDSLKSEMSESLLSGVVR